VGIRQGALLIQGAQRDLRVLCARETQMSIADSVHALLEDQIALLGLEEWYDIQKSTILGRRNKTEFIFHGLKHNIGNIKSIEGCDVAWVEEAAKVSADSWEKLIPSMRKPGSEIWLSWNPELETDATHKRFILNTPPDSVIVKMSWRDNPWFPEVLRIEKDHLEATDKRAYMHVWEGECKSAVEGAIYAEEIAQAEQEERIGQVSYDRTKPVQTFWDIGYHDSTAIWFAQPVRGWYNVIDYLENRGKPLEWYLIQMQQKGYLYGTHWIPWDGLRPQRLGSGRAIHELLRESGRAVEMVTALPVTEGINAARTIFPQCRFDAVKCADGLQGLRHYQWGPIASSGAERRAPLHDWASHPADAFRYMATAIKEPEAPDPQSYRGFESGRSYNEDSWMA